MVSWDRALAAACFAWAALASVLTSSEQTDRCGSASCDDVLENDVLLLQTSVSIKDANLRKSDMDGLASEVNLKANNRSALIASGYTLPTVAKSIEPMFYLHVPKAGSSFATPIVHLACGSKIQKNRIVAEPLEFDPLSCGPGHFGRFDSGHAPLPKGMKDADLSKVVTMFRLPRQRIISGYHHGLHDCWNLQKKYAFSQKQGETWPSWVNESVDSNPEKLIEYANCVQACTTNLLTGFHCAARQSVSDEVTQSALAIIPKLGFVGLTEHWDLSVCLWHAMFGGECLEVEFANTRPGVSHTGSRYDEDVFGNLHPQDDLVYDAAVLHMEQRMREYDVGPATCAHKYCPRVAHLFGKN